MSRYYVYKYKFFNYYSCMIARQSQFDPKETIIQTSVRLPEKLHTELKIIAAKEGRSFNLLLEEIVTDYINNYSSKTKKKVP